MKRPLMAVALFYILGVLLARSPIPLLPLFLISFGLLILCLAWAKARPILLCPLIVLTGWVNLAQRAAIVSPIDIRTQFGNQQAGVILRGVLCDTPQRRTHERKGFEYSISTAQLEIIEMRVAGQNWQPTAGRVMTSTKGILPAGLFAGQTVEVEGTMEPARGPVAEGLFDYRSYLNHQGIYYQFQAKSIEDWRIISSPAKPPAADRFCAWARKALALGLPVEDEALQLEWALALGWKAALSDQVAEPFIRAATYHIFAVDGLRIAIVSGILLGGLKMVGFPRAICGALAMPVIWFYAAMTGWPASAIRAIVMIMVVFGGWALRRPSNLINSLFAATIIILVWEPRQLFQAGFQLSFFVVFCILLILPFFKRIEEWVFRPNPWRPENPQPRWRKALGVPGRYLIELLLTSLAAWLGSIPLVAWYFHLITPLSGPANVLAVPLCGLVLVCDLSSLMLAAWLPLPAVLFNHAGWFYMQCIRTSSQWSAEWPGAYFYLPSPGFFTIMVYYLALITILTGWLLQGNRRGWKIGGLSLLLAGWCAHWLWELPSAQLTVLPLGAGHAVYVQAPGRENDWLIDCGSESAAESIVKPFLRAQGVNRLSNLILTHGEIDFSGGAKSVLELFRPANVYPNPIHFRSPGYGDFLESIANSPVRRKPLRLGDRVGCWTLLHPALNYNAPRKLDRWIRW